MSKLTFIEYLTELMVSDDPGQALRDVKKAARNPDQYKKQQRAASIDDQKALRQDRDDPLKSEKLRIARMKQQLSNSEKRLSRKEKQMAQQSGIESDEDGQI